MAVPGSDVMIRNLSSGKVLEVARVGEEAKVGQSLSKNSALSKNGSDAAQRWRLIPAARVKHEYQIRSVATGMVLEVAGESHEGKAEVSLREDNGGDHQRWRLVPVGEGKNEYAIINAHSGKALDLWNGAWCDDTPIVQIEYWHGVQQRWTLSSCDAGMGSRAVLTIVRNENVFLPIWLHYYGQFFPAQDMYVIDHQSTDGST
ncbi:MAG: RICIN domain-containing protein, partial [Pseudonocardiaceae bacterium]